MFGLCPFHGEKTASFSVAPDKGIYYCFGCHKGGGAINFMMEVEGLTYPDAVRALAKRAGMEVPEDEQYQSRYRQQERLWALMKEAGRFFYSQLYSPAGKECLEYTARRGLTKNIITQFGMGYAPNTWNSLVDAMRKKGYTDQELVAADLAGEKNGRIYDRFRNRLMFPIIDVRGNVVGFGGRVLDDSKPKYLNSNDTVIFNKRKNLFGLNLAKKSKAGSLILVEGNIDVVTMHQYGFDNAVASLGTSLTDEQATLISRYADQVVLLYDGDAAGQKATKRAIPILEKAEIAVKVLQIPDNMDPDDYLRKFGPDKFKLLLEDSSNRVEYQLTVIKNAYDLAVDDQRVKYLQEAAALLSTLGAVQREIYGHRVAELAKVSYEAVKLEINKAFRRRMAKEKKKQEDIDLAPARALQPKSRSIRYDNMKSAVAEEGIIAQALHEPALIDQAGGLSPEDFSVELLGRVFGQLQSRHGQGLEVSLGVLAELTPEEMSHVTAICQRQQGPVNAQAFRDCIRTVTSQKQSKQVTTDDDLLALRNKLKESKGTKA